MKKIKTITAVSSVFFILLAAAVSLVINHSKFSFLIGTLNSNELIIIFAAFAAICLAVSTITAIASKQEKHMVLIKSVIRVFIICAIVYFALTSAAFNRSCDYYEFTSPDGKYTVIAEEWSYLLGGGVKFYERINPLLVMQKESFSTDDGYRAINSGDYSVE